MNDNQPGLVVAAQDETASEPVSLQRLNGWFAHASQWMTVRRLPGRWNFADDSALYARMFADAARQMDQARDDRALGVLEVSAQSRPLGDLTLPESPQVPPAPPAHPVAD